MYETHSDRLTQCSVPFTLLSWGQRKKKNQEAEQ